MSTNSFTTIDLLPDDDDERDQIIARATARESTAEPGRYYVDLPANVTIYGAKPLLHEILTRALAALHADDEPAQAMDLAIESLITKGFIEEVADDEPAADPELVEGDVVALRISPILRRTIEDEDVDDMVAERRAMHVFRAVRDALPRNAA